MFVFLALKDVLFFCLDNKFIKSIKSLPKNKWLIGPMYKKNKIKLFFFLSLKINNEKVFKRVQILFLLFSWFQCPSENSTQDCSW